MTVRRVFSALVRSPAPTLPSIFTRSSFVVSPFRTFSSSHKPLAMNQKPPTEKDSILFVCDIQETFRGLIYSFPDILNASTFITRAFGELGIPRVVTEQVPFKPTVPELKIPTQEIIKKRKFSMLTDEVQSILRKLPEVRNVYIVGIEAHVCVLQTSLDLLRHGYTVYLIEDAISSQCLPDRNTALNRLRTAGCIITSAESAVFEILNSADHEKFKSIVPLVKDFIPGKKKSQL